MKKFVFSTVFLLLFTLPVYAVASDTEMQVSKVVAKADGKDEIIVNVIPCNSDVLPTNLVVTLQVPSTVTKTDLGTVNGTTCGDYRVNFSIVSSKIGQVSMSAHVTGDGYEYTTSALKVTFEAVEVPTPTPTATPEPTPTPTARPTATPIEVENLDKPEFTSFDVDGQSYDPDEFSKLTLKNDAIITVSGKTIDDGKITIFLNPEHQKGTAKADATGKWEYTFEEKMDGGDHSIEAKVADGEGNASKWARIEFKVEGSPESAAAVKNSNYGKNPAVWVILVLFLITVSGLGIFFYRRKKKPKESDWNGFEEEEDTAMSSGMGKKSYVIKENDSDADFDHYVPEDKKAEEANETEEEPEEDEEADNTKDEEDDTEETDDTVADEDDGEEEEKDKEPVLADDEVATEEDAGNNQIIKDFSEEKMSSVGQTSSKESTKETEPAGKVDAEEEPVDMFDEKKFERPEPKEETRDELMDEVFATGEGENSGKEKTIVIEETLTETPKPPEPKVEKEVKKAVVKKPKKSSKKKK